MRPATENVLITGFPGFTAKRMLQKILRQDVQANLMLLTAEKFQEEAAHFVSKLSASESKRVRVLLGDVCHMDLGLSGEEFRELVESVTLIHHLAGTYDLGVDKRTAERVNIEGTSGVLNLARESPRLRRLVHWSTASVSGKRCGVIMEDELDVGQHFHNFYEETKLASEQLVLAAQKESPITIVRPATIVGDSKTGEIDKLDGPYYLMVLIATNALHLRIPMPGHGTAPLHLVPIDHVVNVVYEASIREQAVGKTLHITDSNPFSARRVYELVAELSDTKLAKSSLLSGITKTILKAPGLKRLGRAPVSFLESLDQQVFYNNKNTTELLQGTDIRCPTFDEYAESLVRHVRSTHQANKRHLDEEVYDPFD